MKSKVENIEKNVVKLTIELEAEAFGESLKKAYQKEKGRYNVQGFRKGKAPMYLIERQYGQGVFYEEAFNIAVPELYEKALADNNIEPVSRPDLDIEQIGKDKDLIFTATVTVKPEVILGEYKGLQIEKDEVVVSEEDIQKELEKVQDKNARLISVEDRPVKDQDTLNIDFEGFVDGVAFDGGSAKSYTLVVGSGAFIPGFEEQLVGAELGSEIEVNVTFPEEYSNEDLEGKEAVFKVKVNEIKVKELSAIDDEFAQDVSEFDTLEEYKADIKEKLIKEATEAAEKKYEEEIIKKAVENAEVDIPDVMIENQLDNILNRLNMTLMYQGMDINSYIEMIGADKDEFRNSYREIAIRDVKTQLVLTQISKEEKVEATEDDVEADIVQTAEKYKQSVEDFKKHLKNDDIKYIKDTVITKKTIELMKQN